MGYDTGFRGRGVPAGGKLAESVRESFWKAVRSGLTPTAAATIAGVSGATGRQWARDAGYRSSPQQRGHKYPKSGARVVLGRNAVRGDAARGGGDCGRVGTHRPVLGRPGWLCAENRCAACRSGACYVPGGPMSFTERCRLEELLESGRTQARAAVLLGRDRSTISREARRGATPHGYRASVGQNAADAGSRRPKSGSSRPSLSCSPRFCDA